MTQFMKCCRSPSTCMWPESFLFLASLAMLPCLCYYCWIIIFYLVSSGKGSLTPSHFSLLLCTCALSYFRLIRTQKSKRESVSKLQLVSSSPCIREQTPPFLVLRAGYYLYRQPIVLVCLPKS